LGRGAARAAALSALKKRPKLSFFPGGPVWLRLDPDRPMSPVWLRLDLIDPEIFPSTL